MRWLRARVNGEKVPRHTLSNTSIQSPVREGAVKVEAEKSDHGGRQKAGRMW